MIYKKINNYHYILREKQWFVLIVNKWFKCAPPTQPYPLIIEDDIQEKEKGNSKSEKDME
jgi:hypothetical protein